VLVKLGSKIKQGCINNCLERYRIQYKIPSALVLVLISHFYMLSINKLVKLTHHCVVIFFWYSWIMECTCVLFTFENGVPLMRKGASVVWHQSLLLMNGFNKTDAAVFSCRLCFLRAFPFIILILLTTAGV